MGAIASPDERHHRLGRVFVISLGLLLALRPAMASGLDASRSVITLSNGLNTLSLTTKPRPAQAFLAHRDNGNAHGFDVLTLYIQASAQDGTQPQWQLVPAFDERDVKRRGLPRGEHLALNTVDGADCRLSDFRLLAPSAQADAALILADRELGDGFASRAQVMFRFFKLRRNDGRIGRPAYYFEFEHERPAAKTYCDVGEALLKELGIGPYQPATH